MSSEPPAPTSSPRSLHHEAIARRAHAIWIERGRPAGEDLAHWLAAEAELQASSGTGKTPRDVEDPTPITLDAPKSGRPSGKGPHGGQLPPPHRR